MADLGLKRLESYQYPHTHVGHLSPEQTARLESFKSLCESKGYYSPKAPNGFPSHDDETMLRYLRARKFNPQHAFEQFKDTEDWRKENELDKLYDTIDVQEYEEARRLYPQWTGRRDRRGIPVYVFEVAHLNSKAVAAYESSTAKGQPVNLTSKVPAKMLRLFALYENLVNFALPLCSSLPDRPYTETPVSQSNNIVDISGVGLRQFWNLKNHMQDASQLATAHYPETLDRIFIIGAPSFFPTVWGWIKRWFDPITVSKIFILSKDTMKETLEKHIEIENIPKKYGGLLDYKFGDLPNFDKTIQETLQWAKPHEEHGRKTIPTGPIRWQRYPHGALAAVAVGSEDGKPREYKLASLRPSDRAAQTALGAGNQSNMLLRTTSGIATHPPSPTAEEIRMPSTREESPTPAALPIRNASTHTSTAAHPAAADAPAQSSNAPSTDRAGTSHTRLIDQSQTHAHGIAADGTPEVRDTAGDKHHVMEPNTIGQAPKEHPLPEPEVPQPSYLDQAKSLAGEAYTQAAGAGSSALAYVGVGGEAGNKEEDVTQQQQQQAKPVDPAVDRAPPANVEEYLRSQYPSKAAEEARN